MVHLFKVSTNKEYYSKKIFKGKHEWHLSLPFLNCCTTAHKNKNKQTTAA